MISSLGRDTRGHNRRSRLFYFPDGQRFCDDSYYLLRVLLRAVKINTDANIISACDRIVSDAGRAMNTFEFLLAYILGKFFPEAGRFPYR